MNKTDYTHSIVVDKSPKEVFKAVNNVRGWWSEDIVGPTDQLNETYLYHYQDVHFCKIKIIELVPDRKIVWQVLDNHFSFINDKSEWIGNRMIFEISAEGEQSRLQFTQEGLNPEQECYNVCFEAWNNYIGKSLYDLITTGQGQPNPKEGGFNAELAEKWQLDQLAETVKSNNSSHTS